MPHSLVSQEKGALPSQTGKSHFMLVSSLQLNNILLIPLFKRNDPVGNIYCAVSPAVLRVQVEQNGSGFQNLFIIFWIPGKLGDVFIHVWGNIGPGC